MREHGQHVTYVFGLVGQNTGNGCRCDPCRVAAADYERQRKRRVAPAYVGAAEVRSHIAELQAAGIGTKTIAKRSGVSTGTLSKILHGTKLPNGKRRPPSKRVRPETRDKILAVMPSEAADRGHIDGTRTLQIVDQLLERGWTKAAIARAISGNPAATALQIGRTGRVTAGRARAIEALLDEPVPPRRSRHGLHPVEQPEPVEAPRLVSLPTTDFDITEHRWRARAACRTSNVPGWIFFPGRGDNETLQAALSVCDRCPVRSECLDAHLNEKFGVWGGTSENQRREMRGDTDDDDAGSEAA